MLLLQMGLRGASEKGALLESICSLRGPLEGLMFLWGYSFGSLCYVSAH